MSIISANSSEGINSRLMLFSLPPTDTSIKNINYIEVRPTSQITASNPIVYEIPASGVEYKALSDATHTVKFRVVNSDGTNIAALAKVGVINLTLQSLFNQVDVYLDGKLVSSSDNCYHYNALFETLLTYGDAAKTSQLQSQLYYKDKGVMDSSDPIEGDNSGLSSRYTYTKESSICSLEGKIHTGLHNISRLLLNGVRLTYRFHRNPDSIVLMSNSQPMNFKIEIIDHCIRIPYVTVSSAIILSHAEMLKTQPAMYPLKRSEVKSFSIAQGSLNLNQLISQDIVPNYVLVGFVSSEAFNGSPRLNCFNFKSYNVNYLNLTLDGVSVGNSPFETKFSLKEIDYTEAYLGLFKIASKFNKDAGNNIDFSDFTNGYSLFAFEINPLKSFNNEALYPTRTGTLRLQCKFDSVLPESINVIVYSVFNSVIYIDQTRNVTIEY